jgi:protein TonB
VPRDLFGDVVDPSIKLGSQKWYTIPLSILVHVVLFAAIIIIPLMATDVLPTPPPPPPPPPPPAAAPPPKVTPQPVANPDAAPTEAPREIVPEAPRPSVGLSEGVPGGVEGGIPGGTIGGVVGGLPSAPPPPPPPAAPVRVGGNIKAPTKVRHVNPVYPPIAQSARVSGVVIIEATIGPDGRVKDAKVLRSIPLLDQAALDAVKQWQFTPTLLNGVPVPVIMTVTVNFTLQ